MEKEIVIIDDEEELIKMAREVMKGERGYKFKRAKTDKIEDMLKSIPELIIINEDNVKRPIVELCDAIRNDEDNSITPIIVVTSSKEKGHHLEIMECAVEYVIQKPIDKDYFYYNIRNILRLINTNRRVSPLTGLPGNVQIHAELKKRLLQKEEFAVLYLDLDNFKAYNDVYGFVKGDEIIKFTARTALKHVHESECDDSFVGHIGGDDFVAIVDGEACEKICQSIIAEFDAKVTEYFTSEDVKRGYIEVANRKNIMEQFPLTSLSIGVVVVDTKKFHNILEIGEVGAQIKHIAKTIMGSSYAIDRRK